MVTKYVNPEAAPGGTGSLVAPYNTWDGQTLGTGETWLQRAGTTYVAPAQLVTSVSSLTFGAYDAQGEITTEKARWTTEADLSSHPFIRLNNPTGSAINSLEFFADGEAIGTRPLAAVLLNNACNDLVLENLLMHGLKFGVRKQGTAGNTTVDGVVIHNMHKDGMWLSGTDGWIIRNTRIFDIDKEVGAGDCIQFSGGAQNNIVEGNYLRKENNTKQTLIFNAGDTLADTVTGNIVRRNFFEGPGKSAGSQGIFMRGAGAIYSNLFYNFGGNAINVEEFAATVYHNTIADCAVGIRGREAITGGALDLAARGNIIVGTPIAFDWDGNGAYVYSYNDIHDAALIGDGGSAPTAGSGNVTVNPNLDANYRPQNQALWGSVPRLSDVRRDYEDHIRESRTTPGAFAMERAAARRSIGRRR